MKIKAALIVDHLSLSKWQKIALENASEYLDISLILNCQNTYTKKRIFKHFLYYVANFFLLRNDLTKKLVYEAKDSKIIKFSSIYTGIWQRIPAQTAQEITSQNIKLVIKFGMSLLKIDEFTAGLDILSFHHGDPEYFRGRPAGFYELYNNADRIGIIVQKITNELDAGKILERGYSKIYHHSYKKTAQNFYVNSQLLLRKAIINYLSDKHTTLSKLGPNYRLPSNLTMIKFIFKLFFRKISRAVYGAFFEKKWNIVKLKFHGIDSLQSVCLKEGKIPKIKKGYSFYADPFFSVTGDKIRVEALNSVNGLGEIIEIDLDNFTSTRHILKGPHYSYPYSFQDNEIEYLMPEVTSHSSPYLLKEPFDHNSKKIIPLEGLTDLRLVDSSLVQHQGIYYLFGGKSESSADCLYLYYSENLKGPYKPHPLNPVVMNPKSARMGGRIYSHGGKIYRFGQNNCYGYGNKLTINEIEELTPKLYSEKIISDIAFKDVNGPHTLDIKGDLAVLDFYINKFSIFAGYKRVLARLIMK